MDWLKYIPAVGGGVGGFLLAGPLGAAAGFAGGSVAGKFLSPAAPLGAVVPVAQALKTTSSGSVMNSGAIPAVGGATTTAGVFEAVYGKGTQALLNAAANPQNPLYTSRDTRTGLPGVGAVAAASRPMQQVTDARAAKKQQVLQGMAMGAPQTTSQTGHRR